MLRVFHHYFSSRKLSLFLAETAAIAVSCLLGAVLMAQAFSPVHGTLRLGPQVPLLVLLAAGFVASLQFALYLFDLYDLRVAQEDRAGGGRILKAGALSAVVMGLFLLALQARYPQGAILGGALGALTGAFAVRGAMRAVVGEPSRLMVVGTGLKARAVQKILDEEGDGAFQLVAQFDPTAGERLVEASRRLGAEYVVLALDESRGAVQVEELIRCRFEGARVYEAAGFCERVLRRIPVAHLRGSHLAFADELTISRTRKLAKRTFDLVVSAALLLIASPVMLVVAALIKLDSKGPVFYSQERVGLGGRTYRLWKFRSMRTDAEKDGAVWARANDDRVTRVGRLIRRTRIDEIPQVFNVLFGDMSFVGPRPERPVFVEQLKRQIPFYGLREGVKPGITGWAQIRYPYGASVEDARNKLEFDLYYVKNGSLFLDFAIIFHTVRHVLLGRGAR